VDGGSRRYGGRVPPASVLVQGVSHRFGRGPDVLCGVDLGVGAGEVVAVHGPNGSGKTTLLKIVAGALRPRAGTVRRTGPVGYMPQTGAEPPPRLTAAGWLRFVCRARGLSTGLRLLEALGGPAPAAALSDLSVGSLAKVVLSAALSASPGLVVLDEPFAALDAPSRTAASGLIASAAHEGAVVLLSDHVGHTARLASTSVNVIGGRLIRGSAAPSPGWRLVVADADDAVREVVVSSAERDRVLLDVLSAGGRVLGVQELQ